MAPFARFLVCDFYAVSPFDRKTLSQLQEFCLCEDRILFVADGKASGADGIRLSEFHLPEMKFCLRELQKLECSIFAGRPRRASRTAKKESVANGKVRIEEQVLLGSKC